MPSPRNHVPEPARPWITMTHAAIRLYDRILFQDTNWVLRPGQHWAVLGPTGSGKSTLAKALWGGVPVVRGEITHHFPGNDAAPENAVVHVSLEDQKDVMADARPYYQARWDSGEEEEDLTVSRWLAWENVVESNAFQVDRRTRAPAGFAARRRVALRAMGIQPLLRRKLMHLSNGETRKVMIARALMKGPRVLILDDPFSGLDRRARHALRELITGLMHERVTVILLTSRPEEIPRAITRVLRVEDCRVLAQGSRAAMLRGYPRRPSGLRRGRLPPRPSPGGRGAAPVLVRMRNVNVSYGRAEVLRNIHWTVRAGENWAVLGPNGSGKTTLLSLILGDNPQAYANDIELFGQRRGSGESVWELKKQVGWVSSELHVHYPGDLNVRRVVRSGFFDSVGLYHRCTTAQRRAAAKWIRVLHLTGLAGKGFDELSSGEQRLVLLARALVKEPPLLILDEPCQGLDAAHRAVIRGVVDRVGRRKGVQLLYVTHDLDDIPGCITHVLQLRNGRASDRGTRKQVLGG